MIWRRLLKGLVNPVAALPLPEPQQTQLAELVAKLEDSARARLGRSLLLRHVDSGSCNGCELELIALSGIAYDLERLGLRFTTSPRHADVLMVTGPLTRNLHEALVATYAATPNPKWVVAVGDCAVDGGVFRGSYAVHGGTAAALPVDLLIRGCPPTPAQIIGGLVTLMEGQK
jgi:Ni,Fe-hydrogenase III small subunit